MTPRMMADSKTTEAESPGRSIEEMERELAQTKAQLTKQKKSAGTARKNLKKARKDLEQLKDQYEQLSSESVSSGEVELLVEENEKLQRELEAMKSRKEEMEGRLESMKNEIQTLQEKPAKQEPKRSKTAVDGAQHLPPEQHTPVTHAPVVSEAPARSSSEISVQPPTLEKKKALIQSEFTLTQQDNPIEPEQEIQARRPIMLHSYMRVLDPIADPLRSEEIPNYQIQVVVANAKDQQVMTREGIVGDLKKGSKEYRDTIEFPGLNPGTYLFRVFAVSRIANLHEQTDVVLKVI